MKKFFNKTSNWIILMIPIVFLMSFVLHFIYEWTGDNKIIGAFAPIDESIWEHTKLTMFPLFILYIIFYAILRKKIDIDKEKWFTCMLINVILSVILIPLLYYFVRYGLGIESLILNIVILLMSLVISTLIARHFYIYGKGINVTISLCLMAFIVFIYILFTYSKCNLPIFSEPRQIN